MADEKHVSPEELAHQLRQYLQSLREAGVEWLPRSKMASKNSVANYQQKPSAHASSLNAGDSIQAAGKEETDFPGGEVFSPETGSALPLEERRTALEVLAEEVMGCTRCKELVVSRTRTVFGEGALDPELCFIGEAPGFTEDQQGRPFVGDAGLLLNRIISACGFQREEVYICNILKCRPPGNRTPLITEADNCRVFLDRQLELVRPKYICCLGACAAQNLLKTTTSISRLRKRFYDYNGIPVLCTYHPAYLLRNPTAKAEVWEDMKLLLTKMGRPIPQKKGKE